MNQNNSSWSRNSRYLLSASRDWNVIVWDLANGDRRETIRFDAPVTSASFHPRNSNLVLVTLQNQAEAILVDLRHQYGGRWELDFTQLDGLDMDDTPGKGLNTKKRKCVLSRVTGYARSDCIGHAYRETATIARFNARGDLIFVGSSQGLLYIFDTQTKMVRMLHTILQKDKV